MTVRVSLSIVQGLVLGLALPAIYMVFPTFIQSNLSLLLFVFLPVLAFASSLGLSVLTQYLSCGKINFPQVSLASSLSPAITFGISLLTYFISPLRWPIEAILPALTETDMKNALSYAFFLFWAGIYSQTIAGGLVQGCGAGAAGPK